MTDSFCRESEDQGGNPQKAQITRIRKFPNEAIEHHDPLATDERRIFMDREITKRSHPSARRFKVIRKYETNPFPLRFLRVLMFKPKNYQTKPFLIRVLRVHSQFHQQNYETNPCALL